MSGRGGDAGPGDVAGDELVEGVQCSDEFRRRVGPVRCHQRAQDVVVDLGVEVGEQQPVAGQGVAVAAGHAFDQPVTAQPGQVVAGLVHAVGAVQQAGHQGAQAPVGDAGDREQHGGDGAGQGLHSKVAEPQCGRLPAAVGDGGPGDPLDDWTHKCRALADGFSVQQPGVDRTRLVLQLGQVVQQPVAVQVLRVVDDGFDAQRDAVLQVLLQPGILVEHVEGDQVAVPVDLRLEPAAGGRDGRPAQPLAAAEQQ